MKDILKRLMIYRNRKALGVHRDTRTIDNLMITNKTISIGTYLDCFEKYGGIVQINDGLVVSLLEV